MRIAFIVNNYPPRTGGVELHVRSLAAELARRGHGILVVTIGSEPGQSHVDGVDVVTLPEHFRVADILGFPSFGTRKRLTQLLKKRRIEIVSVHTRFFPMTFIGWRAARSAKIPLIHTEHGSDHVTSSSLAIRLASRAVDFTLGKAVLRGANRVLGVSEEATRFVNRLGKVDAEVFYNAIDVDTLSAGFKEQAQLVLDRPEHLVFVGRIVPGKGWESFLEVVAATHAAGLNTTAEVLGDGSGMQQLRGQVEALGLTDVVTVRGRVSQVDVRHSLRGSTLINPTTLSEGFQTTLLEAIAESGRIVTYPVPGARTLREQGANVTITERPAVNDLIAATTALVENPGSTAPVGFIDRWAWPARAQQFIDECTRLVDAR